jgi:hypothetical protein
MVSAYSASADVQYASRRSGPPEYKILRAGEIEHEPDRGSSDNPENGEGREQADMMDQQRVGSNVEQQADAVRRRETQIFAPDRISRPAKGPTPKKCVISVYDPASMTNPIPPTILNFRNCRCPSGNWS